MIRSYTQADKAAVLQLLQANTPTFFDPSEEADFVHYLTNELEDYFVIEQNHQLLGCGGINYLIADKTARISWDMLHPEAQGKGWGAKLVQHRLDHIKTKPEIATVIVRTSQLAYQFYQKCGFVLQEVTKDYWAKGFDLYYMVLELV
ncbi:GNAT family N-acetyltransferase [Microscilla marina]|uniref:Acetyltransferase, gnat family n=1 Tax=Microscilla marina ATCC 23134 TaxID=313606 RepID=A1ZHN8_MICM2|nr:GNAT family N-acetyltransferase [Microscilla marina]EAY30045.1 acetyltransferase, gnat family [Microscilla marina ATCC 23134]